jgi:hypothetical protein
MRHWKSGVHANEASRFLRPYGLSKSWRRQAASAFRRSRPIVEDVEKLLEGFRANMDNAPKGMIQSQDEKENEADGAGQGGNHECLRQNVLRAEEIAEGDGDHPTDHEHHPEDAGHARAAAQKAQAAVIAELV